jgi:predicted ATPase
MTREFKDRHIGTFKGIEGMERLRREADNLLRCSSKIVIAVSGLPGSGKTVFVKDFVRFGFGRLSRKDLVVIDDSIIYSTSLWRLAWKKVNLHKETCQNFLASLDCKAVILSDWVPSRFLDSAEILVNLSVSEPRRLSRLRKREKRHPEKFEIQQRKTILPVEPPFSVNLSMTLINDNRISFLWCLFWMVQRGLVK